MTILTKWLQGYSAVGFRVRVPILSSLPVVTVVNLVMDSVNAAATR
jgi:hypothetical protein